VEYEIEEALKATAKHKNEERDEKAATLHNVQNAACGSCGFCTSYLLLRLWSLFFFFFLFILCTGLLLSSESFPYTYKAVYAGISRELGKGTQSKVTQNPTQKNALIKPEYI
jgi:hypothetical protein